MNYFKKSLPALLLFVFQFTTNAQVGSIALDFTATDTHGETHHLYDYLEDGKVVVLDFFYTTCGPCQFYSPQVNLAYEKYGCNTADVIFIAIDWGDNNSEVIAYDEEYLIEYPSISGNEGGGNEVVDLYSIFGFPTFYVIDSSKTIIDYIDPPTLQVFDIRFEQHGISPADCNLTAVSESLTDKQLRLFPNPLSNGNLVIDFPESLSGKANLELYDIFGNLITNDLINLDGTPHQLNVNQIRQGTYLIKVEVIKSGKTYSCLFVKI